jgi:hypothetical protein
MQCEPHFISKSLYWLKTKKLNTIGVYTVLTRTMTLCIITWGTLLQRCFIMLRIALLVSQPLSFPLRCPYVLDVHLERWLIPPSLHPKIRQRSHLSVFTQTLNPFQLSHIIITNTSSVLWMTICPLHGLLCYVQSPLQFMHCTSSL